MAISRLEPSNDQANAAEVPGCLPYEQALARFLHSQSETDRTELCLLARELAAQRTPIAEALENNWRTARSFLCSAPDSRQPECVEAIVQSQRDLGQAFDHALRLEARAHTRLASAYAQKTREVTTLLDSLPAFAFMKDSDFRYAAVNQVFCEALGRSPEDLISKTDFDLFPKIVAQRFVERDREVLRGRSAIRHEETVDINGQLRTVLVIKAPVLNPNGTIQFVNPAFERLTGYSRDEAIGRNPRILKSGYHGAEFYRKIWETLGRGQVWQGTIRNKKKDGRLFDADQTLAPVQDREGKTNSYVGVVRDITERKRMVESLQRAVMVKVEFTSMVSHELRTPLTAIKEAIDVVADQTAGPVNQHQAEFLALAKRNVDRLHRLINDTLDFSKLERGEFRLELGPHDLNALTREIVMQQRLAAQKQGLRLELSLEEGLPPVRVDPDRVSQVLVNLIGNAVRYCDGAWIEVSTRRGDGEDVVVKVQDSGPGIPEDRLEHIFEAFVQLSAGPGRRSGGNGPRPIYQ